MNQLCLACVWVVVAHVVYAAGGHLPATCKFCNYMCFLEIVRATFVSIVLSASWKLCSCTTYFHTQLTFIQHTHISNIDVSILSIFYKHMPSVDRNHEDKIFLNYNS